jgi:hypothetical protein
MTTKEQRTTVLQGAAIPCPKCHKSAADVQRPEDGVLEFKCDACGHKWWLYDRTPNEDSDR